MSWQVGDRFHHVDADVPGTVLCVNDMEGTADVRYDTQAGSDRGFTLGFGVMVPLPKEQKYVVSPEKNENLPNVVEALEDANDLVGLRTNQLLNELYHDRARLEKILKNAVALAEQTSVALEKLADADDWVNKAQNQVTADLIVCGSKLAQFAEENA